MKHRAKKSLGQNFLKWPPALNQAVGAGALKKSDTVLEIGPGKGHLTEKLLSKAGKVIAVEKDKELFSFLQQKFSLEIKKGELELIEGDILKLESKKLGKYKLVANIPYNITGAILKKFLSCENQPSLMVLLVQKEVAERILAKKKESMLSISVKAYGEAEIIMKVPAKYFQPKPKVDSAIIRISGISRDFFKKNKIKEDFFWEVVKNGFSHKRKKLAGNLKNTINAEKLKQLGLSEKRAEDLRISDWKKLVS